ncbi:MAG: transglutaminase-like domain-containing protein [Pseudomonadota bacterium]
MIGTTDWTLVKPVAPDAAFPPLLLAAALMVWGYSTELLPVALILAVAYEVAPALRWRWRFSAQDFNRLVDLTAVLFVVVAFYQFDQRAVHGVYGILQWLPPLLGILLLAQRYSDLGGLPLSALFLSIRRAAARGDADAQRSVDFAFPFFVATLLSASAGDLRGAWMFPTVALLLIWGLALARARRYPIWVWVLLLTVVVGGGYALQHGMKSARRAIEPIVMQFLRDYMAEFRDPFKTHTAIGDVGELKLSEQIEMRVRPLDESGVPELLHEATYRQFSRNTWLTGSNTLDSLRPSDGGLTWTVAPAPEQSSNRIEIARSMPRGRGILATPDGSWQLENLGVESLSRHPLGALKVGRGPELVQYEVKYRPGLATVPQPGPLDLSVPREYRQTLSRWLSERGIGRVNFPGEGGSRGPGESSNAAMTEVAEQPRDVGENTLARTLRQRQAGDIINAVRLGLADGYTYTLKLPSRIEPLPLHTFLHESRSGHCEFYATSTVMLLRAAGVPARYATGYAVNEWSPLEEAFVVRRRHAHAWAMAWVDGRWLTVDTTPATWVELEAEAAPWWSALHALGSWLRHQYLEWRWRESEDDTQPWLLWMAVPLIGYLIWRLRAERVDRARAAATDAPADVPGADSELYAVLDRLASSAPPRMEGETLRRWFGRIESTAAMPSLALLRDQALPLHERLRFDPAGLAPHEREQLRAVCETWITELPPDPAVS